METDPELIKKVTLIIINDALTVEEKTDAIWNLFQKPKIVCKSCKKRLTAVNTIHTPIENGYCDTCWG
jgi:hypothetical protein